MGNFILFPKCLWIRKRQNQKKNEIKKTQVKLLKTIWKIQNLERTTDEGEDATMEETEQQTEVVVEKESGDKQKD